MDNETSWIDVVGERRAGTCWDVEEMDSSVEPSLQVDLLLRVGIFSVPQPPEFLFSEG